MLVGGRGRVNLILSGHVKFAQLLRLKTPVTTLQSGKALHVKVEDGYH